MGHTHFSSLIKLNDCDSKQLRHIKTYLFIKIPFLIFIILFHIPQVNSPIYRSKSNELNKDLLALQNYTNLIKSGVVPEKAIKQTLQDVSTSIQTQALLYDNNVTALDQLIAKQKQAAASAKASQIAMQGLYAAGGLFASWAINEGIQLVVTSLNNYIHRVEIASQKTKEAIQSYNDICSEVETLSGKITELNQEMEGLDPNLDSEELKLLKEETEELSTQLALLKEKQILSEYDTDQAAQKSLSMKQDSRYQMEQIHDPYTDVILQVPVKVTKDEELLNAIQKYKEYSQSIAEAKRAQEELEAQGSYSQKEWDRQEQIIQNLSHFSQEVRAYANALALEIDEQQQGLNGSTEESLELIQKTEDAMQRYLNWISSIQTLESSAPLEQQKIQEILDQKHQAIQEALDANHQKMSVTWNPDIDFSDPNLNLEKFLHQELAAYNLSEAILNDLISSYSQAQFYMTLALQNGAAERLSQMGLELSSIQSYADALTVISGGGPVDNWMRDADGYYGDSAWMGDLLNYGKALDKAKLALETAIPTNKTFAETQGQVASSTSKATSALEEQKSALESQKSALEEQKQHYEDVIQAVNWFYDKQIGKVQTLIDGLQKENKLLEKRKGNYDMALSSIDRFYDREIQKSKERQDAVQEKIDALKAENEERRKSYELEKAAYELEKARNQRTDQVYVQGKGMVYVSNDNAVQEAENTYENLLEDQRVSDLEKQKADLDLTIAKLEEYRQLWSEVSSSYQFAQEDMMLSQLLGATWETDLLNGRMETLSLFRDTYNGIQAEINSNEQLIASYEEKIEYYQGLKDQWEELTGKYQEETYIQLLTTEFGNNYENELLNGRTGRWTKFSEEYASIQKQLKEVTDQIEALAARMESYASRMESAASRAKAAANEIKSVSIPSASGLPELSNFSMKTGRHIKGRARGGIVSPKDSNALDGLARSVGEDHLVPLQEGEAVIPKTVVRENAPIVQMLLAGKLNELKMPHSERGILDHPEFRKPPAVSSPLPSPSTEILNLTAPADRTTLQFYGDLSFPNIHSGDDAKRLIEELSHLSVRGRQYFNRQH